MFPPLPEQTLNVTYFELLSAFGFFCYLFNFCLISSLRNVKASHRTDVTWVTVGNSDYLALYLPVTA